MTVAAVAVSALAITLLGAFIARVILSLQTVTVQRTGHLVVARTGFFDFGSSNPAAYSLDDYPRVVRLIRTDPALRDLTTMVTPTVSLYGVAGNFRLDTSRAVLGVGVTPSDQNLMNQWDEYHVVDSSWRRITSQGPGLSDADPAQAMVGVGLARNLGLCPVLGLRDCPKVPATHRTPATEPAAAGGDLPSGLADLARQETATAAGPGSGERQIDLLAATAGGAANVVSLTVSRAYFMGMKELDDSFVGLHLKAAQQLLYGRGEAKATGIAVQLKRTEDLVRVKQRLTEIFRRDGLDLEFRDYAELTPMYSQSVAMFRVMFTFISIVMGVVVLFTMSNTMGMSVMERTNEIGTLRALGVRRSGIRRQFLVEGAVLGAAGAVIGLAAGGIVVQVFNQAGLKWTPPGTAGPIPLELMTHGLWLLAAPTAAALVVIATFAALVPAGRAARLRIVDALRHS